MKVKNIFHRATLIRELSSVQNIKNDFKKFRFYYLEFEIIN